jgi:hypothetical protein
MSAKHNKGGRPRLGADLSLRCQLVISAEDMDAIQTWRFANHIPTTSEAIRMLCKIGLGAGKHTSAAITEPSLPTIPPTAADRPYWHDLGHGVCNFNTSGYSSNHSNTAPIAFRRQG